MRTYYQYIVTVSKEDLLKDEYPYWAAKYTLQKRGDPNFPPTEELFLAQWMEENGAFEFDDPFETDSDTTYDYFEDDSL